MHRFLPLPPCFLLEYKIDDNEEVDGKEGDADDTDITGVHIAAAAAADDADDDAATKDNDYTTMSPKMKPPTKKPTKRESAAAAMPSPLAAATTVTTTVTTFSVDSEDPLMTSYYADGACDNAGVVFHVNGMMQTGEYKV